MSAAIKSWPSAILVADSRSRITSLERDWKLLYGACGSANPFLSWEWQRSWVESHADCSPLVVLALSSTGAPEGLLALQRRHHRGLRVLEFLAQPADGDDLDCLLDPAGAPDTALRLTRAALGRQPWDLLRCGGVRAGSHFESALRRMTGLRAIFCEPGEWLPALRLGEGFEAFLAGQSANFREQMRRRRRTLERSRPRVWWECATSPDEIGNGLGHLFRLHQLRRQQCGEDGIFRRASSRHFVRLAATRLATTGSSRLYMLRSAASVIAVLFGLEADRRFLYYQSGFDPGWQGFSPGTVLLSYVIEDCIRRGLRQFEFLRGEESYKDRWTKDRRRNVKLLAAGSALGRAYLGLRSWRRQRRERAAA